MEIVGKWKTFDISKLGNTFFRGCNASLGPIYLRVRLDISKVFEYVLNTNTYLCTTCLFRGNYMINKY